MSTSASKVEKSPALQPRTPTKVFEGHTGSVTSVAYFSDGKHIISGSSDKTVRIWNVESQKQEGGCLMHDGEVHIVALSPDERTLMSAGAWMVLWDLESRAVMWKKEMEVTVYCVAYSPNGKLIATSDAEELVLMDGETGQRIREPLPFGEDVWSLAFSLDGMRLAAGSGTGTVRVFDVVTGETIVGPFQAHAWRVMSLAFPSTVNRHQIITSSHNGNIRVWDTATGHQAGDPMIPVLWQPELKGPSRDTLLGRIALSHNRKRIASTTPCGTVCLWDLTTRQQIGDSLQPERRHALWSVAWSPDGRSVVTGAGCSPIDAAVQGDLNIPASNRILLWEVPSLNDVTLSNPPSSARSSLTQAQVPIPAEASAPLPSTVTSRSRPSSLSSILDLPATSLPTPSPLESSKTNTGGEGGNRESATNDSFDSLLDLPADSIQPAQRRKRRRRRGAPTDSTSSAPIPAVLDASIALNYSTPGPLSASRPDKREPQQHEMPITINSPHHLPQTKAAAPFKESTPDGHTPTGAEGTASRGSIWTWTRLWRDSLTLRQWTRNRRKPHKNCEERQDSQPNHATSTVTPIGDSEAVSKPPVTETKTSRTAPNTGSLASPDSPSNFISRVRARFRRGKHDPESIAMHSPRAQKARLPKYSRVAKVPHAQADAVSICPSLSVFTAISNCNHLMYQSWWPPNCVV
ncbi:quinon protein alcohol dehydrogenase-like superfamily [Hygrophoropsis aurantiaca]|uniref:Quinon protein alcohol dehydrogenase-like superfamily n=1 Tax=Hygrophoropsis aurantiaca TaxID=72124 RepID=A0ACB7ZTL9_9AGAM|nr:quinon protein alcohol dehydrogenase-like superfamily [Hygrophoropsis aurantiaca]